MVDPYETPTLTDALNDAAERGFREHFTVARGRLRAAESGALFDSDEVTICGYDRFEGVSDPDDMAIVYALATRSGVRGTLTDAYGTYSDAAVGAFMHDVAFARRKAA
jgi:hypothetical protein